MDYPWASATDEKVEKVEPVEPVEPAGSITSNLTNDLNRLATINLVSLAISKPGSYQVWKDGFFSSTIALMFYHQILHFISQHFQGPDADMVGDLVKTCVLLVAPSIIDGVPVQWMELIIVLCGVLLYHKIIRPAMLSKLDQHGIEFNEGLEDLTETVLLLALSADASIGMIGTHLVSVAVYHWVLRNLIPITLKQ
jgi:hypothetical protein